MNGSEDIGFADYHFSLICNRNFRHIYVYTPLPHARTRYAGDSLALSTIIAKLYYGVNWYGY